MNTHAVEIPGCWNPVYKPRMSKSSKHVAVRCRSWLDGGLTA